MAKTKAPGNALALWEQRLADLAKQSKKAVAGVGTGGNFISCRGGNLAYQGQIIPGNKMKVIVVDWVLENQAYPPGGFDEENPQSPFCYAFGRLKEEMRPDPEQVPEPVNETCTGCPNNQWGSAETGRGKACAEVARLALVAEGDFEEIEKANEVYFKVPVTSMKFWAGFVRELEQTYHRPPLAFVTEISLKPQKELPGWHAEFALVQPLEEADQFEAVMALHDKIAEKIAFPYPKFEEPANGKPAPKAAKTAPVARRAVAKPVTAKPVAAKKAASVPKF